jgi:hypothetical protein
MGLSTWQLAKVKTLPERRVPRLFHQYRDNGWPTLRGFCEGWEAMEAALAGGM